jgi:hypothetical protein
MDRVTELESALEKVRKLESEIWGAPVPDFEYLEKQIEAEKQSIGLRDIFGIFAHEDPDLGLDASADDPFSMFLRNLTADFSDIAKFEHWSSDGSPSYTVCVDTAAALVGGDRDIADMIRRGFVALNEMPKELRGADPLNDMTKERAEWVLAKAAEYYKELEKELIDLDARANKGKEVSI